MTTQPAVVTDSDRAELRGATRSFLERHSPEMSVRRAMESELGYDRKTWALLCDQLGVTSVLVPEEFGGTGCTMREAGIVLEEAGRALLCGPLLSSVIATQAIQVLASAAVQEDELPLIASAERRWATSLDTNAVVAEQNGQGWTLSGHARYVLDAQTADRLLLVALVDRAPSVFVVDPAAAGCEVAALPTMDLTRRLGHISLNSVPGTLASDPRSPLSNNIGRARLLASVALAAEQVGGMRFGLELTVEYVKTRVQFGRPVGSFQAVKHRLADLWVEVESAAAAEEEALRSVAAGASDVTLVGHLAASLCSDAYVAVMRACLQLHGGIGFTWEHPTHLYLKRAKSSQLMFGSPADHRSALAREIGLL